MFLLTPHERKVLLFVGTLILCGAALKFFNVKANSCSESASVQSRPASIDAFDINTVSQQDLETIPGIGPHIARRIIEYRSQNGEFKTLEDLKKVKGIGDKKLQTIKNYITF